MSMLKNSRMEISTLWIYSEAAQLVWYENPSGVVIRPVNTKHKHRWSGQCCDWFSWPMTSGSIIFINRKSIILLRIFQLIQPLFPLRKDYCHHNNIDLHVEIIHCIQAIWRHWYREPITTLSRPSIFMSRFIRTDYNDGQIFIPHRPEILSKPAWGSKSNRNLNISRAPLKIQAQGTSLFTSAERTENDWVMHGYRHHSGR